MLRNTDELRFLKLAWIIGFLVLLAVVGSGCTGFVGPEDNGFLRRDAVVVAPEVWVPEWVDVTEAARVVDQPTPAYPPLGVYLVPPATDNPLAGFDCGYSFRCWGLYSGGRVYVVMGLDPDQQSRVMRHEMLHHIIGGPGDPDHCSSLWETLDLANGTSCGSVSRGDHDR